MDIFLEYFSYGMTNLIYSIDPDVIVIGGGVSRLPLLYDEGLVHIQKHFNEDVEVNIVPSALGDASGVFGAAVLPDYG